jgi:hypothetical protein
MVPVSFLGNDVGKRRPSENILMGTLFLTVISEGTRNVLLRISI